MNSEVVVTLIVSKTGSPCRLLPPGGGGVGESRQFEGNLGGPKGGGLNIGQHEDLNM